MFLSIASFLDPKFKTLYFLTNNEKDDTIKKIKEIYNYYI